jgi:hypothetical protein
MLNALVERRFEIIEILFEFLERSSDSSLHSPNATLLQPQIESKTEQNLSPFNL